MTEPISRTPAIDRAARMAWSGVVILIVTLVVTAAAPVAAMEEVLRFEYSQRHMGVIARVVLYAPDEATAAGAARAAFRRMGELDEIMSDYRPASELMRLSAAPAGTAVPVSHDLYSVLERAQTLAQLSNGAFDVTAGPLVGLWREARRTGSLPAPEALAAAKRRTGWRHLRLDPEGRTVRLLLPGMRLDLGAIAKGYAADEALRAIAALGIDRALVEMGGEIAAGAPPPEESGWPVRLAFADPDLETILLAHSAISTSGPTEQFIEIDGVRYSHVLDPRTGLGLTDGYVVTVTAPTAVIADGLSTLVAVLGPDEGVRLAAIAYPDATVYVRPAAGAGRESSGAAPPVPAGAR